MKKLFSIFWISNFQRKNIYNSVATDDFLKFLIFPQFHDKKQPKAKIKILKLNFRSSFLVSIEEMSPMHVFLCSIIF